MGIMILNGGLLTTIQDGGRRGYQRYGMGVMPPVPSKQTSNIYTS